MRLKGRPIQKEDGLTRREVSRQTCYTDQKREGER